MGGCRTGPSPKQASIRDFLSRKSPKANEARRSETIKGKKTAQGAFIFYVNKNLGFFDPSHTPRRQFIYWALFT